jgi:hypothetical protein
MYFHFIPNKSTVKVNIFFWSDGLCYHIGHFIAQADGLWLPTMAAWVHSQVGSCGICAEQNGTGEDLH